MSWSLQVPINEYRMPFRLADSWLSANKLFFFPASSFILSERIFLIYFKELWYGPGGLNEQKKMPASLCPQEYFQINNTPIFPEKSTPPILQSEPNAKNTKLPSPSSSSLPSSC